MQPGQRSPRARHRRHRRGGTGGYEVSTTVGVDKVAKVKVGDTADRGSRRRERVAARQGRLRGRAQTSSSSATYPVVIGLSAATDPTLRDGGTASTAIAIARSTTSALTVPTSACAHHHQRAQRRRLTKGKYICRGAGWRDRQRAPRRSPLPRGRQVVVLADLDAAVPSSNTANRFATGTNGALSSGGLTGGANFSGPRGDSRERLRVGAAARRRPSLPRIVLDAGRMVSRRRSTTHLARPRCL